MLQTVFWIVGAVSGLISIGGFIYVVGYRLARIENRLIDPERIGELSNKVNTLFEVYVIEALKDTIKKKGRKK